MTGEATTLGRFVIQRRIGRGGMGIVYRALDKQTGQIVALKTMRCVDAAAIYRFKREFRALADLSHPNLACLYELFESDGEWFFSMEYIDGVDFLTYVRAGLPSPGATTDGDFRIIAETTEVYHPAHTTSRLLDFDAPTVCNAAAPMAAPAASSALSEIQLARLRSGLSQLARGLSALHSQGKLHRDVKPSNVLVTREERVVLVDFGLALELDQETATEHDILGTVAYLSPEQAAGHRLGPASDWYSVGVMLYQALSGQLPFRGPALEILVAKQKADPVPVGTVASNVPVDLGEICMRLLSRCPEDRPTGAAVQSLFNGTEQRQPVSVAVEGQAAPRSPFVGRTQELQALRQMLETVSQGFAVVVHTKGSSGLGKTALIQQFVDELRERNDVVVLAGRCYERESVSYKALDSLVDSLSHHLLKLSPPEVDALLPRDVASLLRLFPVLRRVPSVAQARQRELAIVDPQELRKRTSLALRDLLARLGDRRLVVAWIDDLQWGDLDSVALLKDLLAPPDPPAMLLILCYRGEGLVNSAVLSAVQELLEPSGDRIVRLELTHLDHEESRRLASELLQADAPKSARLADTIARESGGHPLFVDALVRHYAAHIDKVEPAETVALDEVLLSRARVLPGPAFRLLEVVSIAGHPLRQTDAFLVAEIASETHETVNVLRTARLIRTSGDSPQDYIEPYHDRVREAIAASLPDANRKVWHRRLASALEPLAVCDPAELAAHFQAADLPDRAAPHYATAAARAYEMLAFDRAADLYRLAVEATGEDPARTRELWKGLAAALASAGRGVEAAEQYLALAGGGDPQEAVELRRMAAMQYLASGHIDEGVAILQEVLRSVGMAYPKTSWRALMSLAWERVCLRLRGLGFRSRAADQIAPPQLAQTDTCWSATVGLAMVDPLRAAVFQSRGLRLALNSGEPYRIARALALDAGVIHAIGGGFRARKVDELLAKAEKAATLANSDHAAGILLLMRGVASCLRGEWRAAVDLCGEAERIFRERCTNVAWELNTAQQFPLAALYWMGEFAEMARRVPRFVSEAQQRGNRYALTNSAVFVYPSLAADDPGDAEGQLRECAIQWSHAGVHVQHFYLVQGWAHCELYRGRGINALRQLEQGYPRLRRAGLLRVQNLRATTHDAIGRSALAVAQERGPTRALLRLAAARARSLMRERMPWAEALATMIRAGIAGVNGDDDSAVPLLRRANDGFEAAEMGLHAAVARRRLGEILGGEEGQRLVEDADRWLTAQGIQVPERFAAMYAPGFDRSDG